MWLLPCVGFLPPVPQSVLSLHQRPRTGSRDALLAVAIAATEDLVSNIRLAALVPQEDTLRWPFLLYSRPVCLRRQPAVAPAVHLGSAALPLPLYLLSSPSARAAALRVVPFELPVHWAAEFVALGVGTPPLVSPSPDSTCATVGPAGFAVCEPKVLDVSPTETTGDASALVVPELDAPSQETAGLDGLSSSPTVPARVVDVPLAAEARTLDAPASMPLASALEPPRLSVTPGKASVSRSIFGRPMFGQATHRHNHDELHRRVAAIRGGLQHIDTMHSSNFHFLLQSRCEHWCPHHPLLYK